MEKLQNYSKKAGLSISAASLILASCKEGESFQFDSSKNSMVIELTHNLPYQIYTNANGTSFIWVPEDWMVEVRQCNDGNFEKTEENICTTQQIYGVDHDVFDTLDKGDIILMQNNKIIVTA